MPHPSAPTRRARRKGSGGITLSDVARLAGVSAITISRALNTPDRVSPDTLERVRAAVARTGYVPNLLAGALASNRTRLVAALIPTIAGSVFLETVQALTDTLAAKNYQLMLGQSGYSGSREDALLDAIVGRRPDGIVLTGIMHSAQGRRRLLASGIPVVETWDLTPTPIDMLVGFSHEKVGAQAAAVAARPGLPAPGHRHGRRRPRHLAPRRFRGPAARARGAPDPGLRGRVAQHPGQRPGGAAGRARHRRPGRCDLLQLRRAGPRRHHRSPGPGSGGARRAGGHGFRQPGLLRRHPSRR